MSKLATPARPLWKQMLFRRLKFLAWLVGLLVIVLGGSYLFAPQWLMRADTARQAMAAHVERHSVQVGDTRWAYYEGGEGRTLVLLHGFGADKTVWLEVAAKLTPHFRVIMVDLPGWGDSTRVDGASYNVDAQAARFAAFVQTLRLPPLVLIGHDMGGAIAGVYAAGHNGQVAELALLDATGLKTATSNAGINKDAYVFDDRAGFARATALTSMKPSELPGRFVDVLVKRNQHDRAFIERTLGELRQSGQSLVLQSRLDQLEMPVLGLWCQGDKIVDISALDSLRNGLTHARAISASTVAGCNHLPMLEKPDETAQILTGFALSH